MALRKMAIPFKNFLKNTIISSSQMNDNLSEIEYCHNNLHEEVSTVKSTTYTKTESDKLLNNLDTKLVTTKGNLETSILNNANTLNSKIDTTKNELNSTINSVNTTLDSKINANKNELDFKINANHKDAKLYSDSNKASLIDNAPVNLNTLNKISNAIGNDANFSTNTKNSIDKKANSDDVYTKNEVYTKKEIDLKMDNIETVTRSSGISPSCVKIVTPGEWIEEDGVYFVNLKHNLLASRVLVSMIDLDTGESILPTFKVIDGGNIRVISNYACNASVSILNANIRTEEVNFAQIDDEVVSKYGTWSSEKIDNELNTNKTSISSLQADVDNIYGGNKKLSSEHFVKSYPGKYFSSVTTEKDLNNIKFNIICYVASADGLTNLPSGESGGGGMLEVTQSFANSKSLHVIQRYTNTITNATYMRSFNKDKDVWTNWAKYTVDGQAIKMTADSGACRDIPNNNANDINTTGFFMGYNIANAPQSSHGWVYIETKVHDVWFQNQVATDLHDSSKRWTRHKTSGNWSEWREL